MSNAHDGSSELVAAALQGLILNWFRNAGATHHFGTAYTEFPSVKSLPTTQ